MDPMVVFRCQVGQSAAPGSAGGPAVIGDLYNNFPFINGSGNTSSGISGGYLDYANKATTNTLPLTLVGICGTLSSAATAAPPTAGPPVGTNGTDITTAGNLVEVVFNQMILKVGQTGT